MITVKGLDRVNEHVLEAQRILIRLAEQKASPVKTAVVWGQFFDEPLKVEQYGIYGTSAAIQILGGGDHTANSPLVSRGLAALPHINPRGQCESLYDSSNLNVTFKLAAILEAAQPGNDQFTDAEPVEQLLLDCVVDGHGWGNYGGTESDDFAHMLPTAHALMALRRSRSFRNSSLCVNVLTWFCQNIIRGGLPAHEAALSLVALIKYETPGVSIPEYRTARAYLQKDLVKWMVERDLSAFGETVSYHYSVPAGSRQRNHYVFHVPDLVVAYALLADGSPGRSRSKVLDLVDQLARDVVIRGGFRAKGSQRIASVDQLWAFRLLQEFRRTYTATPAQLMPPLSYFVSASRSRRVATAASLVTVGTICTLLTLIGSLGTIVRLAGGVMATVCLGLLASLLVVWIGSD